MIVLDTNQLDRHSLDSPLMALLKVLAQSTNHELALSVVTYNEHCAHYFYRLRQAYSQEAKARSGLRELLKTSAAAGRRLRVTLDANFDKQVDKAISAYQDRLSNIFGLIDLDGTSAIEALRREAWRVAPASTSFDTKGTGARDAAIWLSLINESVRLAETIYFISSDKRAFKADQCIADTVEASAQVIVLTDIGELLEVLADDVDAEVDTGLIEESQVVREKFMHYLNGGELLASVLHVAVKTGPGGFALDYGDSVVLKYMEIKDVYGHIIAGTKWVTGRVRWSVSYPVRTERLRTSTDTDAPASKAVWKVSFQVVSSLLFKATTDVEDVEILSVGKPSHIIGELEELHS